MKQTYSPIPIVMALLLHPVRLLGISFLIFCLHGIGTRKGQQKRPLLLLARSGPKIQINMSNSLSLPVRPLLLSTLFGGAPFRSVPTFFPSSSFFSAPESSNSDNEQQEARTSGKVALQHQTSHLQAPSPQLACLHHLTLQFSVCHAFCLGVIRQLITSQTTALAMALQIAVRSRLKYSI